MALVNGSNEYWKVYDHAERIYAVKTGDETTVLPFVLLLMTAAGMVAAVFGIRRKENE